MKLLKQKKVSFVLFFILFLTVLGNIFFIYNLFTNKSSDTEIAQIQPALLKMDAVELDNFFRTIAQEQGGVFAYDVLRKVTLPYGIDAHVLGHTIGSILYKEQGVSGMRYCTDEFNNACSHAIAIEHFTKKGESGMREIASQCADAPGGIQGYNMCFHGLGHGVFAYYTYSFEKTISMCRQAGSSETGVEFSECVGGAVMESISGGLHDKDVWTNNTKKYFIEEDPLYPCDSSIFPADAKPICYTYLTPYLFHKAGFAIGKLPTDRQLTQAFSFCDGLSQYLRQSCLEGFGKELVTMANDWDSNIEGKNRLDSKKIKKIAYWCHQAGREDAIKACITSSVSVLYWGGIKDPKYANEFCSILAGAEKKTCFTYFVGQIAQYAENKYTACRQISPEWREECRERTD